MKCQKKLTSEIRKTPAETNISRRKTKKTSRKSNSSKNGLSVKEELQILNTGISIARELLGTLSLGHKLDWIKKLKGTDPEHLRILLQDVLEEIWKADETLTRLMTDPRPRLTA